MKKTAVAACLLIVTICASAAAQDARTTLDAAAKALGTANLRTLEFSGRGFDYIFGQPYDGISPWPRFAVPAMTMTIDFATPALRDDRRRQQAQNPPLGGGFQPLIGELRQVWMLSGGYAWDVAGTAAVPAAPERDFRSAVDGRLAQIWLTPQGFVKAASSTTATARALVLPSGRKTIVTFTAPNKATFEGVINEQGLVEHIETWFGSPVLGDTKFEASFEDYKDFNGLRFPSRIVQRDGGYPVLDLTITDVKSNLPVAFEVPAAIRQASAVPDTVQGEKLADGVWMFPGTAKSIAVEFTDHVVVIDAPETEARSIAVIDAIKKVIPGKPIRQVINTHHHFDHSGGLRTYVAEGATIVTHQSNVAFFENAWRSARTIMPDRLSKSGRAPVFEGVTGSRVITDGAHEIDVYHYPGNMHNAGMLMIYLPRDRTLLVADSWSPPATPGDVPGSVPNIVHFYEAVQRLHLDVERVVPMHGRVTSFDEVRRAVEAFGHGQLWSN
jgi:glyoxylase-like metal-dependent hydrolase (beta-lactamase superfamily II)